MSCARKERGEEGTTKGSTVLEVEAQVREERSVLICFEFNNPKLYRIELSVRRTNLGTTQWSRISLNPLRGSRTTESRILFSVYGPVNAFSLREPS